MLGITNVSNAPSIVLKDTVVSTWTSGSYNGYSYRGTIPISGVTADTIAEVTFSQAQAESGNYSSICTTYDGGLYVYSKVNTQITIPSIIIHSIVETYYGMDNSPVSGSTKAVTSGGVYDAIQPLQNKLKMSLPSYTTQSATWSVTDLDVLAVDGSVVFKLRFYQQGTSRNVQIGIRDAGGTFYWTGLASHST